MLENLEIKNLNHLGIIENNYGEIKQRWLVVESESRKESDIKRLEQKIDKESQLLSQKLAFLSKKEWETEVEANLKLQQISSQLKYHLIVHSVVKEKLVKKKKTRYQITASFKSDEEKTTLLKRKAGRFIIATNKLDNILFTSNDILKKYREQQAPERGFAFLKDPLFLRTRVLRKPQNREMSVADSVFLKNPQRVETMAMLMGLCLMVYALGQRQLRTSLQIAKTGIKN